MYEHTYYNFMRTLVCRAAERDCARVSPGATDVALFCHYAQGNAYTTYTILNFFFTPDKSCIIHTELIYLLAFLLHINSNHTYIIVSSEDSRAIFPRGAERSAVSEARHRCVCVCMYVLVCMRC